MLNPPITPMTRNWPTAGALVAGAAAAIGASACCAGPLLLVLLGVGGAWGSRLVALESWQPLFLAATVVSFGFAFNRLYRRPQECEPGQACALPAVQRRQRAFFWVVALLAVVLTSFPLYAPLFY